VAGSQGESMLEAGYSKAAKAVKPSENVNRIIDSYSIGTEMD
jgi:hypothetical protein